MSRQKIKAKDLSGFDAIVRECQANHIKTYVVSQKRFMVSTDELPLELVRKFNNLGVTVTSEMQYIPEII